MKKMKSTHDIAEGSLLRIFQPGRGYGVVLVIHSLPEFLIAIPEEGYQPKCREGEQVSLYHWKGEKEGGYSWETRCIGLFTDDRVFLVFAHADKLEWKANRDCVQAEVELPFKFYPLHPNNGKTIVDSEQPKFTHATITRLSDRDAEIVTDEKTDSTLVRGHLELSSGVIDLSGKILPSENGRSVIEFMGLPDKEKKTIRDYVYRHCGD
jgi:hypothetical protein